MTTGQYIGIGCGFIAVAIFIIWIMSRVYEHQKNPAVQEFLGSILYSIDAECDALETPVKKQAAIAQIMELLGWRKILVPSALISWCLSVLVLLVRRTKVPDLHKVDPLPEPQKMEGGPQV